MSLLKLFLKSWAIAFVLSLTISVACAQITNVDNTTSTPIPGAGHDYIHLLSETVNPANGSVSLRIQVPMPKGRGITLPFSFAYDSNGTHHLAPGVPGQVLWLSNAGYLSQGGWSYGVPITSFANWSITAGSYPNYYICNTYSDYLFGDPAGGRHALGLGTQISSSSDPCSSGPRSGGDAQVRASLPPAPSQAAVPVTVFAGDGTVYNFPTTWHNVCNTSNTSCGLFVLPLSIEDRSGNILAVRDNGNGNFVFTDTVGRPAISSSGFGPSGATNTVTISGLAYQVAWKTVSENFSVPYTQIPTQGTTCSPPPGINDTQVVVSQITLPNGKAYTFYYGSDNPDPNFQNPYGLLSEIDYPTGGWVKYKWKLSDTMHELAVYPAQAAGAPQGQAVQDGCLYQYKTPVVASRNVGFGGSSTPASVQTFTYSTSWAPSGTAWTQKSTSVSATDNVVGKSALTRYTYASVNAPGVPYVTGNFPGQIPVESSVAYYGWGNTTTPIRTVNKTWYDMFNLASRQTVLDNGLTSKTTYCYIGSSCVPTGLSQLHEVDEYDFGATSPSRKTITNYQNFTGTPGVIADTPCQVIIQDGNSSAVAETDYLYDGGTTVCGTSGTPSVTSVSNLPGGTHDETLFGSSSSTPRGNATTVTRKCLQSCVDSVTKYTYDETGQVLSMTDPCGNAVCSDVNGTNHTTQYFYIDSYTMLSNGQNVPYTPSGNTNAYRTQITNALGQTQNFTYDYNNGQLTVSKDQNAQSTTYLYNDSFARPTQVNYPDGGQATTSYNDNGPSPTITTSRKMDGTNNVTNVSVTDGLGHVVQAQLTSDPQGTVYTDTAYDGLGRVYTVSNPYRSGTDPTTSSGTTTHVYDPLGRKTSETYPSNSVLTTAYCGSSTLVTDPTNRWRRSRVDGLGRLVEVDDPNSPTATVASSGCPGTGEPIWVTSYSYDTLGNLKQVLQNGSHRRNFTFDSLSRLLCSSNPESSTAACPTPDPGTYTIGTTRHSYDPSSNVATKKDARNITITYGYDALNRLTSRTYSNGDPSVAITYDGSCGTNSGCTNIGHRTAMTDAAGSESWAYWDNQDHFYYSRTITIGLSNVTQARDYYTDFLGHITFLHYPNSGRSLNTFYDSAGRPSTMRDSGPAGQLVGAGHTPPSGCPSSGVCYTPQGSVYSINITNSGGIGLNIITTYNNRLQPNEFKASSTGGNAIDISYSFLDPLHSNKNAGHVFSITNNLDTTRSQTFTYDQLNRISSALTTSTHATSPTHCWGETYGYDGVTNGAWGNLTQIAATTNSAYTGCSQESGFTTTADGNNHLTSFSYDLSGNTQNDGVNSYTWDAESQLKSGGGVNYLYDGDGRRVAKVGSKLYWYGPSDEVLDETDTAGNLLNTYFYFAGKRVEAWPVGSRNLYYSEDHLGSSRIITTSDGVVCYDADFYPYGGERPYTNTCPQNNYKFEGKERDAETGNDDFGARYYSNRFGRWLSADWSSVPVPVPYANLSNPQTLNLYAMVSDDPESSADLDGHAEINCHEGLPACNDLGNELKPSECGFAAGGGGACRVPTPLESAWQFTVSETLGMAKQAANEVTGLANFINAPIDAGLAALGINFQFGQGQLLEGSNATEKGAMLGTGLALIFLPGGGEAKTEKGLTYLYEKLGAKSEHLKYGITNNPLTRYTAEELAGGKLKILASGSRQAMLALERNLHSTLPMGREEHQLIYVIKQILKGLRPPPYT